MYVSVCETVQKSPPLFFLIRWLLLLLMMTAMTYFYAALQRKVRKQCDQIGQFIGLWKLFKAFGNN